MERKCLIVDICSKCGAEFDMGYDFSEEDGLVDYDSLESMCWRCRAARVFAEKIIGKGRKIFPQEKGEIELAFGC